jgi:hypothetical protein
MNRAICSWVGHEWRLVGALENILVKRCKYCSTVRTRVVSPTQAGHLREMTNALGPVSE